MKKQSQNINNAGQSGIEVRKSQKHEVNVQKNSMLYFQIGLILCLLGTFTLFEMEFETKTIEPDKAGIIPDIIEYQMDKIKVYKEEVKKEKKKAPSEELKDTFIEKKDDFKTVEKKIFTQEDPVTSDDSDDFNPEDLDPVIDIPDEVNVNMVEFVPIFPGCEKFELNSERRKCLNQKMNKLVQRRFNSDIAEGYGLSGVQRINVEFKVDKSGEITDIRARAPHPKLEKEALKVANKIPKMIPGKMGTTPVNVVYNLPITFKVEN